MAETTKTEKPETAKATSAKPETEATPGVAADTGVDAAGIEVPEVARETMHPKVDVVAVPSLRADGSPDQTSDFKQLVDDKDDPRTDS